MKTITFFPTPDHGNPEASRERCYGGALTSAVSTAMKQRQFLQVGAQVRRHGYSHDQAAMKELERRESAAEKECMPKNGSRPSYARRPLRESW